MPNWKKGPKEWSPSGHIPGMPIWPEFVDAYLEAAIWSSTNQSRQPLAKRFSIQDFAQEAVNKAVRESNEFIAKNQSLLEAVGTKARNGYDFWMSRNGHGTGYFDRGYEQVGVYLHEQAQTYPSETIIEGGDGKLRLF